MAEFVSGQANGLGVLYDKMNKVLSKGLWKNGAFVAPHDPKEEAKLKSIEKLAKQFNERSFDDDHNTVSQPMALKQPTIEEKTVSKVKPAVSVKDSALKSVKESAAKSVKDSAVDEKPKSKKTDSKKVKEDEKEEVKIKKGKISSRSKDTKKKLKKKDVDDEDE